MAIMAFQSLTWTDRHMTNKIIPAGHKYNLSASLVDWDFYWSTGIVAGMSSLLVGIFVTGIVASMGFPTFVADHGCVSSPPNMMIHMALD